MDGYSLLQSCRRPQKLFSAQTGEGDKGQRGNEVIPAGGREGSLQRENRKTHPTGWGRVRVGAPGLQSECDPPEPLPHIQPRWEIPPPACRPPPPVPCRQYGTPLPPLTGRCKTRGLRRAESQHEGRPPRSLCPAGGFGAHGPTGPQSGSGRRRAARGDKGFWRRGPDMSTLPAAARRAREGRRGPPCPHCRPPHEARRRASGGRRLICPHCRPPHGGPGEALGRRGPALSTLPAAARRPRGGLPGDGNITGGATEGRGKGRRRTDPGDGRTGGQTFRDASVPDPPGTRI